MSVRAQLRPHSVSLSESKIHKRRELRDCTVRGDFTVEAVSLSVSVYLWVKSRAEHTVNAATCQPRTPQPLSP